MDREENNEQRAVARSPLVRFRLDDKVTSGPQGRTGIPEVHYFLPCDAVHTYTLNE